MKIFPKGQSNSIKIISLAVGLAMGLVLLAKVHFEYSYEHYITQIEDVYQVYTIYTHGMAKEENEYSHVSGATAPAIKRYSPAVAAATRWTHAFSDMNFKDAIQREFQAEMVAYADSSFFEIYSRPIVTGNPKEVLSVKGQAMISRSIAEKLGGNPVGQTFTYTDYPDKSFVVGGIFEDFPENAECRFDILLALPSIGEFAQDGTNNYVGNDRYLGYLRLVPGTDPNRIKSAIDKMMKENMPLDEIAKSGSKIQYILKPLNDVHTTNKDVKTVTMLLTLIAFVLLFTAVMNYVLIVVSTLVSRAKNIAVRKCYGAKSVNIYKDVLRESAVHLLCALIGAAFLLGISSHVIKDLMGASLQALFTPDTLWIVVSICLVVLLVCGLLPGYLYTRIPLHYAFRRFRESRRFWKLALLFFQFILSSMLISIVIVIFSQYHHMMHKDLGYSYENVVYFERGALKSDSIAHAMEEIKKLPCVSSVAWGYGLFVQGSSGDNITLPGDDKEIMNIADLYMYDPNIFETFNIPIVQGRAFTPNAENFTEVMVDERFVEKMKTLVGWSDNIIGKQIMCSSFNKPLTIVGVYRNFVIDNLAHPDERASLMVNYQKPFFTTFIRLTEQTPENRQMVQHKLEELFPTLTLPVKTYKSEVVEGYETVRTIRDSIIYGCLATLLITLIGLIGYVKDEVARRSAEMAIRKINGASVMELQRLFLGDVAKIALPALLIGSGLAYYLSDLLLQMFADKIALHIGIFIGGAATVALIIVVLVCLQTYKIANGNPVNNLKTD